MVRAVEGNDNHVFPSLMSSSAAGGLSGVGGAGLPYETPCRVVLGCQAGTKGILKECQLDQGMVMPKQGGTDCQEGHGNQCRKGEEIKT